MYICCHILRVWLCECRYYMYSSISNSSVYERFMTHGQVNVDKHEIEIVPAIEVVNNSVPTW